MTKRSAKQVADELLAEMEKAKGLVADDIKACDIFLGHTDEKGCVHVQAHRVWNAERFLAHADLEARKLGPLAGIRVLTREEYLATSGRRA